MVAAADWSALGTQVRLVVTDREALPQARRMLVDELAATDLACSRFRADSELRRLDAAAGRPVPVSPLLADFLLVALEAARFTDGDLDPTMGRAMCELGYDRDFAAVPAAAPEVRVRVVPAPATGWRQVELDHAGRTVRVPAGVQLDLGATAKALAADRAAEHIHAELGTGVLVGLGGDIRAAGHAPAGGWQVRVQDVTGHPDEPVDGPVAQVALVAGGLATSSTTARRWSRGGSVLHHILDPRSGLPADTPWRTVTVSAPTCVAANTASTVAVVRGRGATAWLRQLGVPARLVDHDGQVRLVGAWPEQDDETPGPRPSGQAMEVAS